MGPDDSAELLPVFTTTAPEKLSEPLLKDIVPLEELRLTLDEPLADKDPLCERRLIDPPSASLNPEEAKIEPPT